MRTTTSFFVSAFALTLLVSGCGGGGSGPGDDGAPGANGLNTLVAVSAEAPGTRCTNGGMRIDAGWDANADGVLDAIEARTTQYVCSSGTAGAAGGNGLNTLARTLDEPAGAHCAAGGKAVLVGLDSNANGVLDTGEVSSTDYLCNGVNGANGSNGADGANGTPGTNGSNGTNALNTLVSVTSESAGANCAHGGNAVRSGLDSNANGALDTAEVSSTSYVCSGAPSATLNWITVTDAAVQAQPNGNYIAGSDTQQVRVTLPANLAIGDVVRIAGAGRAGWTIVQNDAQGANPAQAIYTTNLGGMAGAVWTAHESDRRWVSVASSADGSKLVAVEEESGSPAYTSSDGGWTWSSDPSSTGYWASAASSADGRRLAVAGGSILTSNNSGMTWNLSAVINARAVASSADGSRLVAAGAAGQLHTWSDSDGFWTARISSGLGWRAVASSADGNKLVAVESVAGLIHTSNDSGVTWTARESARDWSSVASSADGSKLVAAARSDRIYTSTDSGVTWTARESARNWRSVASSADGSKLVAAALFGQIYTSTDSGVTWTARESARLWRAVASSADGSTLVAAAESGRIYVSVATTTPGAAGSISGGASDAIELQYVGNGMFNVLSHEGKPTVQ